MEKKMKRKKVEGLWRKEMKVVVVDDVEGRRRWRWPEMMGSLAGDRRRWWCPVGGRLGSPKGGRRRSEEERMEEKERKRKEKEKEEERECVMVMGM